jgi:hypothetical protein
MISTVYNCDDFLFSYYLLTTVSILPHFLQHLVLTTDDLSPLSR